jgi:hypothetical protein
MADLAADQHAADFSALGAALGFTGDLQLGTWTLDHDLFSRSSLSCCLNSLKFSEIITRSNCTLLEFNNGQSPSDDSENDASRMLQRRRRPTGRR